MPESVNDTWRLLQSEHTADQLLGKLLELIIDLTDVDELTVEVVQHAFQVQLEPYEDAAYGSARLTNGWNVRVEVSDDEVYGPGFGLHFFGNEGDRSAPMSDICAVDADAFAARLVDAGFERQPYYSIHGGRAGDFLTRGSIRVTTSVRGEASEPNEKIKHSCITSVQVQRCD